MLGIITAFGKHFDATSRRQYVAGGRAGANQNIAALQFCVSSSSPETRQMPPEPCQAPGEEQRADAGRRREPRPHHVEAGAAEQDRLGEGDEMGGG